MKNPTEKISEYLDKINLNWVKVGVIINFLMLLVALPSLFNIHINLPNFDKQEYQIYNTEPEIYPSDLHFLNTSPVYYTEVKLSDIRELKYGDNLKFSIESKNKGKNNIEKPEYRILICDPLGRIRGVYPSTSKPIHKFEDLLSMNDGIFLEQKNKLNFVFEFPPEDQKVTGNWRVYAYLLDKSSNSLVSYNIQDFKVTENTSFLIEMSSNILVTIMSVMAAGIAYKITEK